MQYLEPVALLLSAIASIYAISVGREALRVHASEGNRRDAGPAEYTGGLMRVFVEAVGDNGLYNMHSISRNGIDFAIENIDGPIYRVYACWDGQMEYIFIGTHICIASDYES
jgi:hypothetical protein